MYLVAQKVERNENFNSRNLPQQQTEKMSSSIVYEPKDISNSYNDL
jgi:hypothetical protein